MPFYKIDNTNYEPGLPDTHPIIIRGIINDMINKYGEYFRNSSDNITTNVYIFINLKLASLISTDIGFSFSCMSEQSQSYGNLYGISVRLSDITPSEHFYIGTVKELNLIERKDKIKKIKDAIIRNS